MPADLQDQELGSDARRQSVERSRLNQNGLIGKSVLTCFKKESRLEVADNSGAKVVQVIGVLGGSTARGRKTRRAVGVGSKIVCSVKKALPNADVKAGDIVQGVIVRTKYPTRRSDGSVRPLRLQRLRAHRP